MEFFNNARAVRLKSHLNKYLIADEDEESVHQSRNGATKKARWLVEFVEVNPHLIRLKSCHGKYLCASDEAFLLGMTGKKVAQSLPLSKRDATIEWEPIKEGYEIRLRTKGGGFLRANGATPPWRNSVTHDLPQRTATQDWVLWQVEVVDISQFDSVEYLSCHHSTFSSFNNHYNSSTIISHAHAIPERDLSLSMNSETSSSSPKVANKRPWLSSMRLERSINSRSLPGSPRQGISGMEFFERAKLVRLQSHLGKYLVADDDEETVRQSRNGSSQKARWAVEFIEGKSNLICLKSCHGLYLSATDEAYLLGMTGKKIRQVLKSNKKDPSIEWEPIKEGFHVKLRTSEGTFLRANGATPPWRNSVTHDIPHRTATQDWILWGVDILDINVAMVSDGESVISDVLSTVSSSNSCNDDDSGWPGGGSPPANLERPLNTPRKLSPGMELFKKAKLVKLKSQHNKYLIADDEEEKVRQEREGSSKHATWTVEFLDDFENSIRLKSCFGKYLTATDEQFVLGVTGRCVKQTMPTKPDSSVEWEPIRDGVQVKLKTRYGNFLRANGGVPPWRNSVTHDIPHRHTDWILWEVEVVAVRQEPPKKMLVDQDLDLSKFALRTPGFSSHTSFDSQDGSPMKSEGRTVYYRVADEDGNIDNAVEEPSFLFKGHGLEELTEALEEETGQDNIIVCLRNKFNGQLHPLRLSLPPNNATMHVVVAPSTSKC
ncbi:hypothetical protein LIER_13701 [Lithospermum erythrorhizon]|uniref:Actin cross-linking n=1 Tax=Lithospermum erythrorhizon TaxID=34254 RepID=A0AAV3PZL2_LITER